MASDQLAFASNVMLQLVLCSHRPSSFSQSSLTGRLRLRRIREGRRRRFLAHQHRQSRGKALLLLALATCALAQCVPRPQRLWTVPRRLALTHTCVLCVFRSFCPPTDQGHGGSTLCRTHLLVRTGWRTFKYARKHSCICVPS